MAKNELMIDGRAFRSLVERIDIAAERFPEIRREMFERIAKEMPEILSRSIDSVTPGFEPSRYHPDPAATVRSWQESPARVGTRGGYAAISPKAKTFKEQGDKQYAVGYLTNTLTHGTSRVRMPSGNNPGYRRRMRYGQIRKRPFYTDASRELNRDKSGIIEDFARELAGLLERSAG